MWGFEKGKGLKGAGGCGKCEGGRPMVVSQWVGVTWWARESRSQMVEFGVDMGLDE